MSSGNIQKLSVLKIKKIGKAGRYSDGNCLYLVIKDTGARQWVLRLVIRGKRHDMGLGSSTLVSLEEARDLARQYRRIAVKVVIHSLHVEETLDSLLQYVMLP